MFVENRQQLKIKTKKGWESFRGMVSSIREEFIVIECSNHKLEVTPLHSIKVQNIHGIESFKEARYLQVGDLVVTEHGTDVVKDVYTNTITKPAFDVVATSSHTILANGICVHQCDEFAHVKPSIQNEFWTSISPTLSTGGSCIIASTPNGDNDMFANIWRGSEVKQREGTLTNLDFHPLRIEWNAVPGRDEEWKQSEIAKVGALKFQQEYECLFISSDPLLVDTNKLKDLNDVVTAPLKITKKHGIHMWESFSPGRTYLVGVDPSTGSGSDYSVINVFSFPEMVQVAQWRSNTMSSPELYIILKDILRAINTVGAKAYFSIENNGVGEGVISLYQVDDTQPANCDFVSDANAPSKRLGFTTINRTKLTSCLLLKDLLEKDSMTIRSPQLLSELKTFIKKSATYTAQYGCTDDSISSVLIVLRILENITGYEQMAFDKIFIERKRKANVSLTQRSGVGHEDFR